MRDGAIAQMAPSGGEPGHPHPAAVQQADTFAEWPPTPRGQYIQQTQPKMAPVPVQSYAAPRWRLPSMWSPGMIVACVLLVVTSIVAIIYFLIQVRDRIESALESYGAADISYPRLVLLALIPAVVIGLCVWLIDRWEREPIPMYLVALGWGAGMSIVMALEGNEWWTKRMQDVASNEDEFNILTIAVGPGVVEEGAKAIGLLLMFFLFHRYINGPVDGIVLGLLVGVGFAFTENIYYFAQAAAAESVAELGYNVSESWSVGNVFLARAILAPFVHPLSTAMTGMFIGFASTLRNDKVVVFPLALVGYGLGAILHGLHNFSAVREFAEEPIQRILLQMPVYAGAIALIVMTSWLQRRATYRGLVEYAMAGWISRNEIAMVMSLTNRQRAKVWAKASVAERGGRAQDGLRAMRRFQHELIQLGYARSINVDRRTAHMPSVRRREAEHLELITRLRQVFAEIEEANVNLHHEAQRFGMPQGPAPVVAGGYPGGYPEAYPGHVPQQAAHGAPQQAVHGQWDSQGSWPPAQASWAGEAGVQAGGGAAGPGNSWQAAVEQSVAEQGAPAGGRSLGEQQVDRGGGSTSGAAAHGDAAAGHGSDAEQAPGRDESANGQTGAGQASDAPSQAGDPGDQPRGETLPGEQPPVPLTHEEDSGDGAAGEQTPQTGPAEADGEGGPSPGEPSEQEPPQEEPPHPQDEETHGGPAHDAHAREEAAHDAPLEASPPAADDGAGNTEPEATAGEPTRVLDVAGGPTEVFARFLTEPPTGAPGDGAPGPGGATHHEGDRQSQPTEVFEPAAALSTPGAGGAGTDGLGGQPGQSRGSEAATPGAGEAPPPGEPLIAGEAATSGIDAGHIETPAVEGDAVTHGNDAGGAEAAEAAGAPLGPDAAGAPFGQGSAGQQASEPAWWTQWQERTADDPSHPGGASRSPLEEQAHAWSPAPQEAQPQGETPQRVSVWERMAEQDHAPGNAGTLDEGPNAPGQAAVPGAGVPDEANAPGHDDGPEHSGPSDPESNDAAWLRLVREHPIFGQDGRVTSSSDGSDALADSSATLVGFSEDEDDEDATQGNENATQSGESDTSEDATQAGESEDGTSP